jgi:3-hydroxyacyl-CoA dehydrogenase/enoyl-CoA hydratase/3-hydroxybutyryl-CoA epimerase
MTISTALTLKEIYKNEKTEEKILSLTFDLPGEKVNKFSQAVIQEFGDVLTQLESRAKNEKILALIVRSEKPGIFIAGADIQMIQSAKTETEAYDLSRFGQNMLNRWEDLPFPTIATIRGAAMGGGCELSLASTAIIMSDASAAKIALPEVMLGIIPGMGGCVRMTQKVGLATALDLILTGKGLNGQRAYKAGLTEAVLPDQNFDQSALQWVLTNLTKLKSGERIALEPKLGGQGGVVGSLLENNFIGKKVVLSKAEDGVKSKTRGHYPAPLEAIQVIRDCGLGYGPKLKGKDRDVAMEREAKGFAKAAATAVSKNLIKIFYLTEAVKKSKGVLSEVQDSRISTAAVLGAGVMGGGIAQLFAEKEIHTRMKDLTLPALETGMKSAAKIFQKQVKKRRITQRQAEQKMNYISPVLDYTGFRNSQVVVEAVIEKMQIKQSVFKELENNVSDQCVIASNTSSLSVTEMQSVMKHPERFGGMHFFNPVAKMPLVEVIRGAQTSDQTVSAIYQLSKQIGKTPIVVKDSAGFLVNRLLLPYLNEATWCLKDGATIKEIDEALARMEGGVYGICEETGDEIEEKRLQAIPWTRLSLEGAEVREREQKRYDQKLA